MARDKVTGQLKPVMIEPPSTVLQHSDCHKFITAADKTRLT